MLKRNLWKLILSFVIGLWAVWTLLPLKDRPFAEYAQSKAQAKPAEFSALMKEAGQRHAADPGTSEFVALKQIAKERRIDLSQFYPGLNLGDVQNIERKNNILLDYLLKASRGRLQLGLDLNGGISVTLEADPKALAALPEYQRKEKLSKAIQIIGDRINKLGVAEPVIRAVGENRIEIQLPGVNTKDNPEVVDTVKKPARLDFRLVHPFMVPQPGTETPAGYEILTLENENRRGETSIEELFVKQRPEMNGDAIARAVAHYDQFNRPEVSLQLTSEGKKQFAKVTGEIAGYTKQLVQRTGNPHARARLAIVLDGKLYSAPGVENEIMGDAVINGIPSEREAQQLESVLNNPLDVPLQVKEQYEVGPSLAAGAIASGKTATYVGIGLVAAFMIGYYTLAGLIAVISVVLNITILLGVLAMLGATLTMPGIAGIVLTVGMAVDAHILIFERMREELAQGKSLVAAFHAGHDKAFTTIVDANLTTFITSGLMIIFGNGPVRGFGVTITIGIFTTMFTALIVSEMLLQFAIFSGFMKRMVMLNLLKAPKFDYVKYGRMFFIASWIIVAVGVVGVAIKGHKIYGIDFAGGDVMNMSFKQQVDIGRIQAATDKAGLGEIMAAYQSPIGGGMEVLNIQTEAGKGDQVAEMITKSFPEGGFAVTGKSIVGPSIGQEIQWNALMSIGLSIVGIMIYVAFRFEMGYGIGAVVSTIHDVLMTVGIFVLSGRQFTAPMVGAILLIVGYSINDTIVVFDRIREELKLNPNLKLSEVINLATSRVFARSCLTSLTTFLAALALYLFGGGVINDLSFTFLVGIVTGTFSSIFIASPIFYWWHKGDRKHVEKHQDVKPTYEWTGASKASQ
ncbi:MAG: protein translocase subunit SecD [Nibricoccus sp.]